MAEHVTENNCGAVKLAGYLEKKKKKALVSSWKRYWFVLEGRLLLYYKNSKGLNLCPCKGSINMGLATDVRPFICRSQTFTAHYMFEIISHTYNTIWLRTNDRTSYEKWLQALLDALGQPTVSTPVNLTHFRYSMDSLIPLQNRQNNNIKIPLKRQNTLPSQQKNIEVEKRDMFMKRIKQMGGYTSKSLDIICKESRDLHMKSSPKIPRSKHLSRMCEKNQLEESNTDIQNKDPNESTPCNRSETKLTASTEYEFVSNSLYSTLDKIHAVEQKEKNNTDECVLIHEGSEQKPVIDENKNCCILKENNQLTNKSFVALNEEVNTNTSNVNENNQITDDCKNDTIEYYYSYGELKDLEMNGSQCDIYSQYAVVPEITVDEPVLPPRHEKPLDSISSSTEGSEKKLSRIQRIKKKFFSNNSLHVKDTDSIYEKINKKSKEKKKDFFGRKRLSFLMKVIGPHKKKENQNYNDEPEPDYDYVDYDAIKDNLDEINKQDDDVINQDSNKIVGGLKILSTVTMTELKSKLSSKHENEDVNNEEEHKMEIAVDYEDTDKSIEIQTITIQAEVNSPESEIELLYSESTKSKPGLPEKKHVSRPRSPWHDVPSNNTPYLKPGLKREIIVSPQKYELKPHSLNDIDLNIDNRNNSNKLVIIEEKINYIKNNLNDSSSQSSKEDKNVNTENEENSDLSVKQLIEKYNCITCVEKNKPSVCKIHSRQRINEDGVTLRREKCTSCLNYGNSQSDKHIYKINRNSDELNRLLEELAKITNAPLLQPGVTNSLVQVRPRGMNVNTHSYGPLSDEEWLALTPIRRRRHSEPDYDIPRSHRSLIQSNQNSQNLQQDEEIPKTRFFGPILPSEDSSIRDSIEPSNTICSTSITPDSLEPLSIDHLQTKNHIEKDRSISNEICQYSTLIPIEEKPMEDNSNLEEVHSVSEQSNKLLIQDNTENVINNQLINDKYYDSLEQSTVF